jgi:hypothetical protein
MERADGARGGSESKDRFQEIDQNPTFGIGIRLACVP